MTYNVVDLKEYKDLKTPTNEHYFLEVVPAIVNEEIIEFVYIFKTHQDGISRITPYSKYFLHSRVLGKSIANMATNTKVNAHGKFIVSFLNYIFYESERKITEIQQLDRELIMEFLQLYAKGQTKNQKGQWVNRQTIEKAGHAIMRFVYWLKYGKVDTSISGLGKITKKDFDIAIKEVNKRKTVSSGEVRESHFVENFIKCPTDFIKQGSGHSADTSMKNKREKVMEADLFTVKLLIDTAFKHDPEMVLPIVLGAFVGLRQGDVIQMNRQRVSLPIDMDISQGCKIELLHEVQISHSTKDTGKIKKHRLQPIYEPFLPTVIKAYNNHLELIKERGLNTHKYGALFFNRKDDGIMRQSSLNRRFKKIVDKVIEKLRYESLEKNNEYATKQYNIISESNYKLVFHSLRYFYTQSLEKLESNAFTIMYYRGDEVVESQNTYRGNTNTIEGIKKIMDSMKGELDKYGFDSIL